MMYETLFDELEAILSQEDKREERLKDFFRGPARYSIEWSSELGGGKRVAAHLFVAYVHVDSTLWNWSKLSEIYKLLPAILESNLEHLGSLSVAKPLILMCLSHYLEKIGFAPAAHELIEDDIKRKTLISTLSLMPPVNAYIKRFVDLCELINWLKDLEVSRVPLSPIHPFSNAGVGFSMLSINGPSAQTACDSSLALPGWFGRIVETAPHTGRSPL